MSSALALADEGSRAISKRQYDVAITKLTAAIEQRAAPHWLLERSTAYLRTNRFDLALKDAETALQIGYDRANRDHMMEAQLRRAIAFFRMGHFADADICAYWSYQLAKGAKAHDDENQIKRVDENGAYTVTSEEVQKTIVRREPVNELSAENLAKFSQTNMTRSKETNLQNQAISWRIQAIAQMEKVPADHDGRKVHITSQYSSTKGSTSPTTEIVKDEDMDDEMDTSSGNLEELWSRYQTLNNRHKIRCSFYQTDTTLTVDVFVKNLSPGQVTVNTESQVVEIRPVEGASLNGFDSSVLLFLFDEIDPAATKYTVKSMKIELVLQKKRAGKWPQLRCKNADIVDNLSITPSQGIPFNQFQVFLSSLGYNNDSDLGLPDFEASQSAWYVALLEKLRSRVKEKGGLPSGTDSETPVPSSSAPPLQKVTPIQEKENIAAKATAGVPAYPTSSKKGSKNWDSLDSYDAEEEDDGDANDLFKKIYQNSDPDTRRAMMKSFTESNGTSLSTCWEDAKDKTYTTQPPDGVEAKKWD
ncbi:SGS-domain-containing protein [Xylaria venustula]|nr:SGS-domain-containing protein [Xylaria venustula]